MMDPGEFHQPDHPTRKWQPTWTFITESILKHPKIRDFFPELADTSYIVARQSPPPIGERGALHRFFIPAPVTGKCIVKFTIIIKHVLSAQLPLSLRKRYISTAPRLGLIQVLARSCILPSSPQPFIQTSQIEAQEAGTFRIKRSKDAEVRYGFCFSNISITAPKIALS